LIRDFQFKKTSYDISKYERVIDIRYDRQRLRLRCSLCELSKQNCKHTRAFKSTDKTNVTDTIRKHLYQKHRLTPEKRYDDSGIDYIEWVDYNKPTINEVIVVLKKIEQALANDEPIENIPEIHDWGMLVY